MRTRLRISIVTRQRFFVSGSSAPEFFSDPDRESVSVVPADQREPSRPVSVPARLRALLLRLTSALVVVMVLGSAPASAQPVADFTWSPEDPPINSLITFTDTSTGGTGGTITINNAHPQPMPAQLFITEAGDYEMKLTEQGPGGPSTKIKWLNVGKATQVLMTASKSTVKTGQSVAFEDRSTGLVKSRKWTFGDGASSTTSAPSHSWSAKGTFTVTLEVTYTSGKKSATKSITVTEDVVTEPPDALDAGFDWSPETPFIGQKVTFTDRSKGSPTSRNWSLGDGTVSTDTNPTHKYEKPGRYSVVLVAKRGSEANVETKEIFVASAGAFAPLEPQFDVQPECVIVGKPVWFIDQSDGFPIRWKWNFGNGSSAAVQSPSGIYSKTGDFTVTMEISDGYQTKQTSRKITVHPDFALVPHADFASPCCAAVGVPRQLTNTSSGATSFLWDFGDGTTSTQRHPVHSWANAGNYMVNLKATNDFGDHTFGRSIYVTNSRVPPIVAFEWSPSPNVTPGMPVQFTNRTTPDAVEYHWSVDGPGLSRQVATRDFEQEFPQTGIYKVTLVATNAFGIFATHSEDVPVVSGKLVAAFQCGRTGSHVEIFNWCGGCPCTHVDPQSHKCLEQAPSNCQGANQFGGVFNGCIMPIPYTYDDYACSDRSSGNPDHLLWALPGPSGLTDQKGTGPGVTFKTRNPGAGLEYSVWVHHVVTRDLDGLSSTAVREIHSNGGGGAALESDFSWSPGFPRVDDEITFVQKASGGATLFTWIVDWEKEFYGPTLTYKFDTSGRHEVILRVHDGTSAPKAERKRVIEVAPRATPAFKSVTSRWGQCFFSSVDLETDIDAEIDWGGLAAKLTYSINGGPPRNAEITNSGGTFSLKSSDLKFASSDGLFMSNTLTLTAKNAVGDEATSVFPLNTYNTSGWIENVTRTVREEGRYTVTNVLAIPQPRWEGEIEFPNAVPFVGGQTFGLKKTQGTIESSYRTDCNATTTIKGQTGFQAGPGVITGAIYGREKVTMGANGIFSEKGTLGFELAGAIEPKPIPVATAIPAAAAACAVPGIDAICDILKVKSEFKLAAGAEFDFKRARSDPEFIDGRGLITPSLKVGLIGEISSAFKFELWGGGQAVFTIHPVPPILRKIELGVESGFVVSIWLFQNEQKMSIVCSREAATAWTCLGPTQIGAAAAAGMPLSLKPMPIHRQAEIKSGRMRALGESVVLESLSPVASPVAAGSGNEIMAVYLAEKADASNPLHRTDVRFTKFENGDWTASAPVFEDNLGDFAPALTGMSDGRFVALWQRLNDASLRLEDVATIEDISKLNRKMEIVASVWSPATNTWSVPAALTSNDAFDHDAHVVALGDGRALAVWLRDPGNGLTGTPASPTQVVSRVFDGNAWGAETVVGGGLFGVQSLDLAAHGSNAIVVLSRDRDGSLAASSDREIAFATFSNNGWGAIADLTNDAVADVAPRAVFGSDGARVFWSSGSDLVWQRIGGTRELVRTPAEGATIVGLNAAVSSHGEFVVVWSETNGGSTDVIARTWDPGLQLWSDDIALTRNDAVESSLSVFFQNDALQVVALETQTDYVDETRVIDGQEVVVHDVPQPGDVGLVHLDKHLVADLAVDPLSVGVSDETPSSGDLVTLTASVCNTGDLPLRNVPVAVYAGRGTAGSPIATGVVNGDWKGGETKDVTIAFPYNDSATEVTVAVDAPGDASPSNDFAYFSYRNAPPDACVQVSRMIGTAPASITFDARCSTDLDGSISSSRWSFGDGGAADGALATHVFSEPGIFNATVTVTDDLGRSSTATATIYIDSIPEMRSASSGTKSLYLPVAGRTAGAGGTFFVSDATIYNGSGANDLVVDALYMPDGRIDFHYEQFVIPPDRFLNLPDLVARSFHGATGVGWVRFDVSDPHAQVTSRSYNQQPFGTAGTLVPAATSADAVRPLSRRVFLQDWRTGFRTNIGFTEIEGAGAEVTVSLFTPAGAPSGTKTYTIKPWAHVQINGDPLLQQPGRIEVATSSGAVLAYVSTIDNLTGDAVYQAGIDPAALIAGDRWVVPVVTRTPGNLGTQWRSDARVWNAGEQDATVTVKLFGITGPQQTDVVVKSGATLAWDDVVSAIFPQVTGSAVGPLMLETHGRIAVTSRIYNQATQGSYGMAAPPRAVRDLLVAGEIAELLQLESDEAYRCNFGMTALEEGAEVQVRAFNAAGELLASRNYDVAPMSNRQIGNIFAELGIPASLPAARLQIHVLRGTVYGYASVIDNRTGDAVFVEASR